jgi:hypothetical protein
MGDQVRCRRQAASPVPFSPRPCRIEVERTGCMRARLGRECDMEGLFCDRASPARPVPDGAHSPKEPVTRFPPGPHATPLTQSRPPPITSPIHPASTSAPPIDTRPPPLHERHRPLGHGVRFPLTRDIFLSRHKIFQRTSDVLLPTPDILDLTRDILLSMHDVDPPTRGILIPPSDISASHS